MIMRGENVMQTNIYVHFRETVPFLLIDHNFIISFISQSPQIAFVTDKHAKDVGKASISNLI